MPMVVMVMVVAMAVVIVVVMVMVVAMVVVMLVLILVVMLVMVIKLMVVMRMVAMMVMVVTVITRILPAVPVRIVICFFAVSSPTGGLVTVHVEVGMSYKRISLCPAKMTAISTPTPVVGTGFFACFACFRRLSFCELSRTGAVMDFNF